MSGSMRLFVLFVLVHTVGLVAQSPGGAAPVFEVASVKPHAAQDGDTRIGFPPGGRFVATNANLRALVALAYGTPRPLPNVRVVGGPGWLDTETFDIEAKAADNFQETQTGPGFSSTGELMLRALLADRFKLVARQETRQLPIYALVMDRSDRKLGSALRSSSGDDCYRPVPGAPPRPFDVNNLPCGSVLRPGPGKVAARFATLDQIAGSMEGAVGRVVVNRTALDGTFSFDIQYAPTGGGSSIGPPRPAESSSDRADEPGMSLFTVLREQLGLKLESATGPVDVVVIERVEKPSPN